MLLSFFANLGMLGETVSASNWQADYWKRGSKKERDAQTLRERIALGILPPEAADAVRTVFAAKTAMDRGRIDEVEQVRLSLEAREAFESAFRQAYKDSYISEVVSDLWRREMKRITRRRKAAVLLLH